MKKMFGLMVIAVVLMSMVSCASINVPVAATSNEVGTVVGQSSGIIWFNLYGTADAGIQKACQNAGIKKVSTVDFEYSMLLFGLGSQYTCTVTGSK